MISVNPSPDALQTLSLPKAAAGRAERGRSRAGGEVGEERGRGRPVCGRFGPRVPAGTIREPSAGRRGGKRSPASPRPAARTSGGVAEGRGGLAGTPKRRESGRGPGGGQAPSPPLPVPRVPAQQRPWGAVRRAAEGAEPTPWPPLPGPASRPHGGRAQEHMKELAQWRLSDTSAFGD